MTRFYQYYQGTPQGRRITTAKIKAGKGHHTKDQARNWLGRERGRGHPPPNRLGKRIPQQDVSLWERSRAAWGMDGRTVGPHQARTTSAGDATPRGRDTKERHRRRGKGPRHRNPRRAPGHETTDLARKTGMRPHRRDSARPEWGRHDRDRDTSEMWEEPGGPRTGPPRAGGRHRGRYSGKRDGTVGRGQERAGDDQRAGAIRGAEAAGTWEHHARGTSQKGEGKYTKQSEGQKMGTGKNGKTTGGRPRGEGS
ncbi:hypothetical protein OPQ81_009397 [Rhizoctonia solani]|nr:hypothetical protein OPQ81_009397 [Rhizoctonia solani]